MKRAKLLQVGVLLMVLALPLNSGAQSGEGRSTGERAADALDAWIGGERPPERGPDRYDSRARLGDRAAARCEDMRPARPSFDVREVIPSSGSTEIRGTLEGECVDEAGYYEDGRLRERISFPLDDRMQRREFRISVDPRGRGELRAYTRSGEREVLPIDSFVRR